MSNSVYTRVLKLCVLVAVVVIILLAFDPYLWVDEVFSLNIINNSFANVVRSTANDVHPPLYYLMLKVWVEALSFGSSDRFVIVLLARGFSICAYLCTATMCYKKLHRKLGADVWLLILTLFAAKYILYKGVEIRMYSWGLFFVTATFLFALDIMRGEDKYRSWVLLALSSLGAAYTHNFALISAALVWLFLFVWLIRSDRHLLMNWAVSAVVTILLFLPWLIVLLKQTAMVAANFWIPPMTAADIAYFFVYPFSPMHILFVVVVLVAIWSKGWRNVKYSDVMGICIAVSTILVGIILSLLLRPVYLSRYIVPAYLCLWLSLIFISRHLDRRVQILFACMVGFGFLLSSFTNLSSLATHIKDDKVLSAFLNYVDESALFVVNPYDEESFDGHIADVLSYLTPCTVIEMSGTIEQDTWQRMAHNHGDVYIVVEDEARAMDGYRCEEAGAYTIEVPCHIYKLIPQ